MPFSQTFLAAQKEHLLADKIQLEKDLSDLGKKDPQDPTHFKTVYPESQGASEDDNATEVTEFADDLSIEAKLEAELRDTVRALGAIEKGTYGVCKYCGKEIDEKRLEARPASSACVSCKKTLTQEM